MNFNIFDKNDPKDFSETDETICIVVFIVFILIGFATPMGFIMAGIVLVRQIARFQERKKLSRKRRRKSFK